MNVAIVKVLIVVTSHNLLGTTGRLTGYYLPEVSHPYFELENAGFQVDIASPKGGKAPMDESSRDLTDLENKTFLERNELIYKIENTIPLSKIKAADYRAILFAGGHGTMWDFADNEDIAKISASIYDQGGVVAAICHGSAALINIKLSNGKYLVAHQQVTGFSNEEEEAAGLTQVMPFLLETALIKSGGFYTQAPLWQSHVEVSDRLITGQNPASAKRVGQEIVKKLTLKP
jgi:putative intracellular protease/amidase